MTIKDLLSQLDLSGCELGSSQYDLVIWQIEKAFKKVSKLESND